VLVSARRFRDLGVTGEELPELAPIQETTRALVAPEMVDEPLCHPERSEGGMP
jgi:hypothetical protein